MTSGTSKPRALRRRTKVVATLGPASRRPDLIRMLIRAGVNVFRLNMSHGDHEQHQEGFRLVREAAQELAEPVAILADLCGPKIRVGTFAGGQIELAPDEVVTVTTREVEGRPGLIPSQYRDLVGDVKAGDRILLDDGLLELRVEEKEGTEIRCRVIQGGPLKDRKGMNLPGVAVSTPALTEKDKADLQLALELGVDYFALSFVRHAADIHEMRAYLEGLNARTPVIAKIEKPEALTEIDEILDAADGIMVARGDLGVEMAPEQVPLIQQDLVTRARSWGKPVIVATQMLESMVEHSRPTRAEVSDVSTAVLAGADAVMLSSETSIGSYPVRAAEMMDRIARQMEDWLSLEGAFRSLTGNEKDRTAPLSLRAAVARSTAQLSRDLKVPAVVVRSRGGVSATAVSASRPAAPIVAMTTSAEIQRRLSLLWGVIPCLIREAEFDTPSPSARMLATQLQLAGPGQVILLLAGFGKQEPTITVLPV